MDTDFSHSESLANLAPALVKAQAAMGAAVKDAENPFYHSKYADLATVIAAWKEPLAANGIALLQPVSSGTKGVRVTTLLLHESGEWLSATVDFPADKEDSQAYGKAVSYARRYSSQSFLSIPSEDDDAQEATHGKPQRPRPFTPPPPAPKPEFTPLAPQPAAPLQEIPANREKREPVTVTIDEGPSVFYQFTVGNNAIGMVREVTEVPSSGKTHWRFLFSTGDDHDFTAKMWTPDPSGQGYQHLVDKECWYRIRQGEWRGQVQYTIDEGSLQEVTDENRPQ